MRTTPEHPSPAAIHEKSDTAESAEVSDFAPDPSSSGPNIWFANRFPKVHKNYGGALQIKGTVTTSPTWPTFLRIFSPAP
jgi:hypothetical protein